MIIGFLFQAAIVLLAMYLFGAIVTAIGMAWKDWRRAAYKLKVGMPVTRRIYNGADWLWIPAGWPAKAWIWLDDHMDQLFDELD